MGFEACPFADETQGEEMTPDERKATPIYSGVVKYFPRALAAVARVSRAGNEQHHPGTPLHWDKSKSTDHLDAALRHLIDDTVYALDDDGVPHLDKAVWRILAELETREENRANQTSKPDRSES